MHTKTDDTSEMNIPEDFDNRPSKKAKISESGVLESSPMSPTMSASNPVSECFESIVPESENQIDHDPLPSPSSSTLTPVLILHDVKEPDPNKGIKVDETYDYLPQDYTLTDHDLCAHIAIESSLSKQLLVEIDGSCVLQNQLMCLLNEKEWINDDVINAYICCIKDQIHLQNDNKVYFESPFVTSLFKRDGELGIQKDSAFMTETVVEYMQHDMIKLPINANNTHWYLAVVNTKKREVQVLESLCWDFDRDDLAHTLRGVQFHLDLLKSQNLVKDNWKDVDLTEWKIIEQLQKAIQTDSSSCGLFMIKFMEYFTGCALSYPITQEMITSFRFKLASILLCWKTNTAARTTIVEESNDDTNGDPDDVQILESLDDIKISKKKIPLSVENKYRSLISILSNMSVHELTAGLCSFIKSINYTEILEKVWIQSSKPYPISLSLRKLQEMLKDDLPMDKDCFNLVVRKIMFDDIQTAQKTKHSIAKHYLDMKFWMTTDFGRHPEFRKKLDAEQLANTVRNWPGIKYNVSTCKTIHIPVQSNSDFILFTLDKDTRTMYILDPAPINPMYRWNPLAKYVRKIIWIAEHLQKAMSKACPGSIWNEDILLWHQKILDDIPVYNRELSGYVVPLFMSTWENERPHLPILKDGYELRKIILGQLLTFKDNESEDNMPAGVLEFINCIRKIQSKSGLACYF
ncbi:uncharacterized protein LOC119267026 isoform X3 [Triticum dicoccoides]|uniref:uncharacterized protein LOC119267026 isoform X3 n=1 Tax=Triticum dicoccoides TaxID=85692 RepID=UPI00188F60A6|nr:uncharacterized protein LOC119267026 isoform X3 [Triticum dicoccoides]